MKNQELKALNRKPVPHDDEAARNEMLNRMGLRHAPYEPKRPAPIVRTRHWSKPVWWERTKLEDGTWTAVPHYGKRIENPPLVSHGAKARPMWAWR